jgi:DNA-directed RNA polymerase specialized sigma24 family protein
MTTKTKGTHYVNNAEFLEAMKEWKARCAEAESKGDPQPPVTNYIGECFLKIANHLSYRPNFINYTYRDEMISDGIENCLQYASNFNPEKSKNPFAYFTQIIYYAFIRRIQKEKKQQHVKHKLIENMNIDLIVEGGADSDMDQNAYIDYLQKNFLPSEDVYKPKKKKTKPKGLENFYSEEYNDEDNQSEGLDEDSTDNGYPLRGEE